MAAITMSRPDATEFGPSFGRYVSLVPEGDILLTLERQTKDLVAFLRSVPESEANKRHLPYTWSIKEVVGHLIDAERVFGYRAMRIARNDTTPLAGFEENDYVRNADFDAFGLGELTDEFESLRCSHVLFFRHLQDEAWLRSGTANNNKVSVRALASIIAGHVQHHFAILRKRVGKD
jgi:hypothetical protein